MGLQIFYSLLAGGALSLSWRLHEGTWSVLTTFLSAIFLCKVGTQASHSKKLSYLAGLIAIGVAFSWLNNTIVRFGGFPAPLALGVYTLFTFGSATFQKLPLTRSLSLAGCSHFARAYRDWESRLISFPPGT